MLGKASIWKHREIQALTRLAWNNSGIVWNGVESALGGSSKIHLIFRKYLLYYFRMKETITTEFTVKVVSDPITNRPISEFWYLGRQGHAPGDQPAVTHYDEQGRVTEQIWMQHNARHRLDGPAHIKINPDTGVIHEELWMREGLLFRQGRLPTFILRDPASGEITKQSYDGCVPLEQRPLSGARAPSF
ncbi:hypothetical protein [Stappia indica]|uniref:hypothetical protein n=1 Tax=Stappia indica TaxID=538381 RepID=UPI001D191A19|nr:hypothetical protein [Stappia indica]MCC4242964.1 hypothetical protein [Stappia indica]